MTPTHNDPYRLNILQKKIYYKAPSIVKRLTLDYKAPSKIDPHLRFSGSLKLEEVIQALQSYAKLDNITESSQGLYAKGKERG